MNSKQVIIPTALLCYLNLFSQTNKPNIIFILEDEHFNLSAGFNGNDIIKTPKLDKLAKFLN